jgi:hypothetical protein
MKPIEYSFLLLTKIQKNLEELKNKTVNFVTLVFIKKFCVKSK